jgi:hypothetical protein
MAVKTSKPDFSVFKPSVEFIDKNVELPIAELKDYNKALLTESSRKLKDAQSVFDSLGTIEKDLFGFTHDNPYQKSVIDDLKKKYGVSRENLKGLTLNDLRNAPRLKSMATSLKSLGEDPIYAKIVKDQARAAKFKEKIFEVEGQNKQLAARMKAKYLEYLKATKGDIDDISSSTFSSSDILNPSEFEIKDIDKYWDEQFADLEKEFDIEVNDEGDGILSIRTKEGFKLSEDQVKDKMREDALRRAKNDPAFRHNLEAFVGLNTGDTSFDIESPEGRELIDKWVLGNYKKVLKEQKPQIRNKPRPPSGGSRSRGKAPTDVQQEVNRLATAFEDANIGLSPANLSQLRTAVKKGIKDYTVRGQDLVVSYGTDGDEEIVVPIGSGDPAKIISGATVNRDANDPASGLGGEEIRADISDNNLSNVKEHTRGSKNTMRIKGGRGSAEEDNIYEYLRSLFPEIEGNGNEPFRIKDMDQYDGVEWDGDYIYIDMEEYLKRRGGGSSTPPASTPAIDPNAVNPGDSLFPA